MPQIRRKDNHRNSLRRDGFKGMAGALFRPLHRGSLTVEAALVLPLFLFVMVTVLFLFRVLQLQYMVGEALDKAVAEAALEQEATAEETENKVKLLFYGELVGQECPVSMIALQMAGFSWEGSVTEDSYIQMKVAYRIRMPGWILHNRWLPVTETSGCRRWTGRAGSGEKDKNADWVYVTPNGTVYHRSRECTHLKLSIQTVTADRAASYRACELCAEGKAIPPFIYITEEGECYHTQLKCSGLKRTVYMIPLREAGGRSPCLRCGGD